MKKTPSFGAVAAAAMGWETHAFQLRYTSNRVLEVAAILKTQEEAAALIAALSLVGSLLPRPLPAELSTPSARSDIPQDPVFISELSAAGEKSDAVGGDGWISVKECALPSEPGTFLVTNALGEVAPHISGIIHNNTGTAADWQYGEAITHWMPLPLAPSR